MEDIEKDMTPRLIGETYKRRTPGESSRLRLYGLYECQYCGKEFEARTTHIKNGDTKSCGCLRGDAHGLASHRFYGTWSGMLQRCTNPKYKNYVNYGARGITVCEEWLDIKNFIAWAESTHPNEGGYTLDRIDNNKGYSLDNCRWVDASTQAINRRIQKNNTSGFVGVSYHNGKARWISVIKVGGKGQYIGTFNTIEEAVLARDNYIIENKLPHKLSKDYKRIKDEIYEF